MNRDDVIRMAREADLCPWVVKVPEVEAQKLERFANLIAAAEREACAQVCDKVKTECEEGGIRFVTTRVCAKRIRARGANEDVQLYP